MGKGGEGVGKGVGKGGEGRVKEGEWGRGWGARIWKWGVFYTHSPQTTPILIDH